MRRKLDFLCLQEVRYKGAGASLFEVMEGQHKIFYNGRFDGAGGVGVIVSGDMAKNVIEVQRVGEQIIVLRVGLGSCILNVISVYAPQMGRSEKDKEGFYMDLLRVVSGVSQNEKMIVAGDFNGHVGQKRDGFPEVHGGFGIGERNAEG